MGLITNFVGSATELLTVFAIFLTLGYYLYYKHCYTYWKNKNVPSLPPTFPVGNLSTSSLGMESVYVRLENLHKEFKRNGYRYGGIYFFNGPVFMAVDPEFIKNILISDFDHFVDRGMYINEEKVPLTAHIFSMTGDQWKNIRTKLSPVFTSGKMKCMYNIIVKHCQNLLDNLKTMTEKENVVDMKEILMRLTTDIIGTTAFGIDCNSVKYPDTEFNRMVRMIFKHSNWKLIKLLFEEGLHNPGNLIKIAHDNKFLQNYFTNLVKETVEYREQNKVERDDFLNILIHLKNTAGMSITEVVAQSFLFFTAGFETSSSTMSYCLHELTYNQDIQEHLRDEIWDKLGRDSSKYTYDDIMTLPYLDMVVKETLRKYPPVAMLNRVCVKAYKIPGTETIIEKGIPVVISVLGLQRDEEFFPDPLEFIPERFNGDNKITSCSYLPFGDGPRNCIGLRFGLMQTKLGLATLLNDFKFSPTEKSTRHLVIDPSTTSVVLNIAGSVNIKCEKI